jgi:hypothetical protein
MALVKGFHLALRNMLIKTHLYLGYAAREKRMIYEAMRCQSIDQGLPVDEAQFRVVAIIFPDFSDVPLISSPKPLQ